MKKVIFFLLFFYHFSSISQPADGDIVSVIISPVDASTINIYTNVHFLNVVEFYDFETIIDTENYTIDLNLCYFITPFPLEGGVAHNNLIDVTGLTGEYTLNINVFENSEACYLTLLNTITTILPLPLTEEIVLSISTFELKNKINIYPNPVQSVLNINTLYDVTIPSILIYDVQGKLVLKENGNVNQLDVSSLASGLFFVKVETNKGVFTKKIIKE